MDNEPHFSLRAGSLYKLANLSDEDVMSGGVWLYYYIYKEKLFDVKKNENDADLVPFIQTTDGEVDKILLDDVFLCLSDSPYKFVHLHDYKDHLQYDDNLYIKSKPRPIGNMTIGYKFLYKNLIIIISKKDIRKNLTMVTTEL